jgi:hypothetical protein
MKQATKQSVSLQSPRPAYGSVAPLLHILEAASEAFASQGDDEGIDKAEKCMFVCEQVLTCK